MGYFLGIDLGTTKNAVVLHNPATPEKDRILSAAHQASPHPGLQDVEATISAVKELIAQIPEAERQKVEGIALTGQMHSIVMWNRNRLYPAVTWQDSRISEAGELDRLRELSGLPLSDGFGGATLAFLALRGELNAITGTSSLPDYLGIRLTGRDKAVIDPSFAASWGIYDLTARDWHFPALSALSIPLGILPKLVPFGAVSGKTRGFPGLPDGIPVYAAIGDNQASVLGSSANPQEEIFITVGTGAQLSLLIDESDMVSGHGLEYRPFPGGKLLAVAAPLCGGKSWDVLVNLVNGILTSLSLEPVPEKRLLDTLDQLALRGDSSLQINTGFLGERRQPDLKGSIGNITLSNLTLPNLARGIAEGIANSICSEIPQSLLQRKKRIAGTGNAIRHFASLRSALEKQTALPLELHDTKEEAAYGAIFLVL